MLVNEHFERRATTQMGLFRQLLSKVALALALIAFLSHCKSRTRRNVVAEATVAEDAGPKTQVELAKGGVAGPKPALLLELTTASDCSTDPRGKWDPDRSFCLIKNFLDLCNEGAKADRAIRKTVNLLRQKIGAKDDCRNAYLALQQLTELNLNNTGISDVSALVGLDKLEILNLGGNQIADIRPLIGLLGLRELYLEKNPIVNIAALADLVQLTSLYLAFNPLESLYPLKGMVHLTHLNLNGTDTGAKELFVLANFHKLVSLSIVGIGATSLDFIKDAVLLERLYAQDNAINDLANLSKLTKLKTVDLSNNRIEDASPLAASKGLHELNLSHNPIDNTLPLRDLAGVAILDLSDTKIKSVIGLTKLPLLELKLQRCTLLDATPILSLEKLKVLDIRGCTFPESEEFFHRLSRQLPDTEVRK